MENGKSFIDGQWRSLHGKPFTSLNPATEEIISKTSSATSKDVDSAVNSSRRGFEVWRQTPIDERLDVLKKLSQLLEERIDELARIITLENGKPLVESNMEVMGAQMYANYYATETKQFLQDEERVIDFPQEGNYEFRITFEPLGVVGIISPWSWPLLIPFQGILPALAAGNCVVFKPSSFTPLTGQKVVELLVDAGLPKGAVNLVQGRGQVGERLVRSNVDAVAFTGGNEAGLGVAVDCAKKLKRAVLELGGSDPCIVFSDAQLEEAVNGALYGRFFSCGQICVAAKRILVEKGVFDEFTRLFAEKVAALKVGNGLEPSTDIGPLISGPQRSGIVKIVREATSKGAKNLCGGSVPKELQKGFFYSPTVLTNVTLSMQVMTEEVFGPVAPVMPFEGEAEAIEIANSTRYGLGASVWTADSERALRLARNIRSGIVWINDVGITFPHAPWGGIKDSGLGRHSSRYGLLELVNIRQICTNRIREPTRLWWLPYKKG